MRREEEEVGDYSKVFRGFTMVYPMVYTMVYYTMFTPGFPSRLRCFPKLSPHRFAPFVSRLGREVIGVHLTPGRRETRGRQPPPSPEFDHLSGWCMTLLYQHYVYIYIYKYIQIYSYVLILCVCFFTSFNGCSFTKH